MLDHLIKWALRNRMLVAAISCFILVYGAFTLLNLPIDVLPNLDRPNVTLFIEAGGMSPEEIETQINLPLETALNGMPGVQMVRSTATSGMGMVFVDFDWQSSLLVARQLVSEKIQNVPMPEGIKPVMGPMASIMGQIMVIALYADSTSAADLRSLADFTIRRRLMSIKGVAQVIVIGGERKQYQVLIDVRKLNQYQISIDQIEQALQLSNQNSSGGFFDRHGSEVLIRNIGRAGSLADLKNTVITGASGYPVLLSQLAEVKFGAAMQRGDASYNAGPAVLLTVEKQPGSNTVALTEEIEQVLNTLKNSLPADVKIDPKVFQQRNFINNAIGNVVEALRDGFILVMIVLFLFLLNFRTTIITLTAIPLSLVITALVFKAFAISVNTLTLGGLAIAIGELVDDAIVDVENVFRRLKENRQLDQPKPSLIVIYQASSEVRNSIVYATIIVVLVFIPLFYMQGIEGKIFAPLGIAYITSITASLLVSLTLTPVLCSYLLVSAGQKESKDSPIVRWLKRQDTKLLHIGFNHHKLVMTVAASLIVLAASLIPFLGTEFLPPFNEGSFTINLSTPIGTSLSESNKMGVLAEKLILKVPEVAVVSRRTGRAALDEHVEPVSNSEIDVLLKSDYKRSVSQIIASVRQELAVMKGVSMNVGQPISHRLDHLLSGVRAQLAVKLFGEDLSQLRLLAEKIKEEMESIPGITDLQVEKQFMVPQLLIKIDREALKRMGLQTGKVAKSLEILLSGKVVSQIIDGQKSFDLLLRSSEEQRSDIEKIRNTPIANAEGALIPLHQIADIQYENGQSSIMHENTQRRIVISANIQGRDLGSTVGEVKSAIAQSVVLPPGYHVQYGGQFESQQAATFLILGLSMISAIGVIFVLYSYFRSFRMVMQVMTGIPLALVGSVIAVTLTGGTISVATLVGFITLTGISARNGIMMIAHYIHLIEKEGLCFGKELILKGSLERLVPVLMTALVTALALVPLTLDPMAAGKEILYPVAVVILGGLISSTLLDILVTPVVFYIFGEKALISYFSNKIKPIV